ncbi:MAG TPA: sulfatase [Prolixibacteraceae bacterium]|nr:sulfatase [Prolixibacteraceae bacterium]
MKKSMLKLALLPVVISQINCPSEAQSKKMNVLFISVDDMNNNLGCFGHPLVKSPNIDRLASSGIAFANAYCQFPLCSPSRSSLLTGLRPDRTRVFDLRYHFRQDLPDRVTLPQMFMNNGYFVARVGKMYHYGNPGDIGTNGLDDRVSWSERYNPAGRDKTSLELDIINYTPQRGLGSSMSFLSDKAGKDEEHTDGKVADQVIELLKKNKNKPFFIGAGFYKPHCPWVTPSRYFDLYQPDQISLPLVIPSVQENYPAPALASTNPLPYFGISNDQAKDCKLAYFAAISFVDAQIGRLLDALRDLGLEESTIVVFWSDHGYHLGEHGLWFKQSCFEESAKTPLIISVPGLNSAGKLCRKNVELIDIYPTLAALTGQTPPNDLDGLSLVPLLKNPGMEWDHPAYTQVQRGNFPGHSVRTALWRYTEWDFGKKGVELYNEETDPQELNNLASNPLYSGVIKQMQDLLKKVHPAPVDGGKAIENTKEKFSN